MSVRNVVRLMDIAAGEIPVMEGFFDARIKRELAQRQKEAEAKGQTFSPKTKSKFGEYIRVLQDLYTNDISQLADYENKATTAQDVYQALLDAWGMAVAQYGLDPDEYKELKKRLDSVRQEWADDPRPFIYQDKDGNVYDKDDPDVERDKLTGLTTDEYRELYLHRLGKDMAFLTEKEHLAAIMAWWLTAGSVASAASTDKRPAFGSIRWINARDTGGIAKDDPQLAARKNKERRKAEAEKRRLDIDLGNTGHGHVTRDAHGKPTVTPIGRSGGSVSTDPGRFNKDRRRDEHIDRIADLVCENVDDTWMPKYGQEETYNTVDMSDLGTMTDRYASYVSSAAHGDRIFLADDQETLRQHREAKTGDIVPASEILWYYDINLFREGDGRVIDLDSEFKPRQPRLNGHPRRRVFGEDDELGGGGNQAIEQAKAAGGQALKQLLEQLKILQKDPGWAAVKTDIVNQLKPFLG